MNAPTTAKIASVTLDLLAAVEDLHGALARLEREKARLPQPAYGRAVWLVDLACSTSEAARQLARQLDATPACLLHRHPPA